MKRTIPVLLVWIALAMPAVAGEGLPVRLDREGPVVLLSSKRAAEDYAAAIAAARKLHPGATEVRLDPADPAAALPALREAAPRYALLFLLPDEIDVDLAWRWLDVTTRIDADPFVDVRSGFVTGRTPAAAVAFVARIAAAASGELSLPAGYVDDLGPNTMAADDAFLEQPFSVMLWCLAGRMPVRQISHGKKGFTAERLGALRGAGLVHFGGHGYPDRIVSGVTAAQAAKLDLSPCVVWNGACYTGVTGRWFEMWNATGKVRERAVAPGDSFCLRLLENDVVGYLAALHPDHGIPVYQELETLAATGAALGETVRATMNGVILGSGGKLPALEPLLGGRPPPRWTPSDVMLRGTASRVLFGDPALRVLDAAGDPALEVAVERKEDGSLLLTATPKNRRLRFSLMDTYHADLAANPNLFNDRALVTAPLPEGFVPESAEVVSARDGEKHLRHRLVGWGVEEDAGRRLVHVQVDLEAKGYAMGPWRGAGARLTLRLK